MPHRNIEDAKELEKSLNLVSSKKNIILIGDFNCPDIKWDTMTVNQDAQDKEIQRVVMEVVTAY
jgi:endonuclease/exonuclease/phosphatase family metal-dependent hydrolase